MRWNTTKLKAGEDIKKNRLYELSEGLKTVVFTEEHEDSEPEIVDVEFIIPENGSAIAAKEYRNKDLSQSKAADILCILLDETKRKLSVSIYDIKRTMTGFDEAKSVEELRKEAVKRILDFLSQMQDSMIHKEGLVVLYRCEGYHEIVRMGLITREFNTEKIKRLGKRLESAFVKPSDLHGMVGRKYYIATQALRKEAEIVKNFGDKKIKISNQIYDLKVVLLEYSEEKNAYYKKIVIGE